MKQNKDFNKPDLLKSLPEEQDYIKYFEKLRWRGIITSPFDPTSKVYKCKNNKYKCKNTNRYFNVRTGTAFEGSKISLQNWLYVLYSFVNHKKGISSYQLARDMGITQKSAWFMLHRLRQGFDCPIFKSMLGNEVEIDETFLGGKNKNRHWNKKVPQCQGRNWKDKIPVWGAKARNGNLIARVVPNTQQNTLETLIKANVKEGSTIYSDEWYRHSNLSQNFNHQLINHSIKQYVNGKATTNRIENVWSHLKRMIYGIYHKISRKHSQSYINEFTLRHNTRKYSNQDRFNLVLSSMIGRRMTYQQLIN